MNNDQTNAGRNSGAGSPTEPMSASQTSGGSALTSPIAPPPEPSLVSTSSPFMPGNPTPAGTEANAAQAPADGARSAAAPLENRKAAGFNPHASPPGHPHPVSPPSFGAPQPASSTHMPGHRK